MFTGLTLGTGEITRRRPGAEETELTVEAGFDWAGELQIGESVSVSGVCLTVTARAGRRGFAAFASAETLARSTLGRARLVNLERALALGDRLGGHLVSGHIDGTGAVRSAARAGASLVYGFAAGPELLELVVPKGSIAIDGVSLTVNEVSGDGFTVNLIPHTAGLTTLGRLKPGDQVNLETDLLGKYVQKLLRRPADPDPPPREGLTMETLARNGFI